MIFVFVLVVIIKKINIIIVVFFGLWYFGVFVKIILIIDYISSGCVFVNVVSGWFKGEFNGYGELWLDYDECYCCFEEFINVFWELWKNEMIMFKGDFYWLNDVLLKLKFF